MGVLVALAGAFCVPALYLGIRAYANLRPAPSPLPPREIAPGVLYERRVESTIPRVEHWVRVSLAELEVVVTDGDDHLLPLTGRTTTEFAREVDALVALNGGFFEPWEPGLLDPYPRSGERVAPLGLAASQGHVYSRVLDSGTYRTLYVSENGQVSFAPQEPIFSAISGGCALVEKGTPVAAADCSLPKANALRQPRTAIGLSADRQTLYGLVIDGRQRRYSAGATLDELARLLAEEGVSDAINLDGGGSSVLVARTSKGHYDVLSTPISGGLPGHERVVGSHIAVRYKRR